MGDSYPASGTNTYQIQKFMRCWSVLASGLFGALRRLFMPCRAKLVSLSGDNVRDYLDVIGKNERIAARCQL